MQAGPNLGNLGNAGNLGNLNNFNPGPIPTPQIPMIPLNGLQATPCADCGGLGLKMYQEKDGLRVWVTVVFHLIHPHVIFCASIENGGIEANLQLAGGAGVTATLDAASSQEFTGGNIKEGGLIPLDITVPIGGILQDVAPAAVNGLLYLAGRAPNGDLWWWEQTGSQWTWIGNNGVASGPLAATPR